MSRTKGAKGKKTIAKEMGMTLEQYEKYLLGKEILTKGIHEINAGIKEEKDKLDKVAQPLLPEQDGLNLEYPKEPTFIFEQPEIIIGEQKCEYFLQKQNASLITDEKLKEVHDIIVKKTKKEKELPKCKRCHCDIPGPSPFRINLTSLTTKAPYHRQTEDDHGMILLCNDCVNKLNKLIDKFLYDDGNGVPLKYGAKEFIE